MPGDYDIAVPWEASVQDGQSVIHTSGYMGRLMCDGCANGKHYTRELLFIFGFISAVKNVTPPKWKTKKYPMKDFRIPNFLRNADYKAQRINRTIPSFKWYRVKLSPGITIVLQMDNSLAHAFGCCLPGWWGSVYTVSQPWQAIQLAALVNPLQITGITDLSSDLLCVED